MKNPDWSGSSGDIWARRWRDTDRGLAEVGAVLDQAIADAAPAAPCRALDVGSGPGTTALSLAARRPDASILGCDLSEALLDVARERAQGHPNLRFVTEDAETAARRHRPFELIFSRHGVMFFDDPIRAFRTLHSSAAPGGRIVFSCFRSWDLNPWASELTAAAAGAPVDAPDRRSSGFAFADANYVGEILQGSGWRDAEAQAVDFHYVAGSGPEAVAEALDFLAELGPASRVLEGLGGDERDAAMERMRAVVGQYRREEQIVYPGAAWIWTASAE